MLATVLFPNATLADGPFHDTPLVVATAQGQVEFRIEVVTTPEERARGLMFRRQLADDAGMLFDFEEERSVSMWMKNTYIALDMVFITGDGRVHRIAEYTEPHSLDTIASGAPVRYVLEIAGGQARKTGIKPGDIVSHPAIAKP